VVDPLEQRTAPGGDLAGHEHDEYVLGAGHGDHVVRCAVLLGLVDGLVGCHGGVVGEEECPCEVAVGTERVGCGELCGDLACLVRDGWFLERGTCGAVL